MARRKLAGQVVGASVRGAAHVRANLPNQDAFAWLPASGRGESLVVAVSDGHGSGKSFRSGRGAQLAVEIATRMISQQMVKWSSLPAEGANARLSGVGRDIVERWTQAVDQDIADQPFSEDELHALDEQARREIASNQLLAYGATLLVAAVTDDRLYLVQLGDGDILFVALDGTAWLPLSPDQRMAGNETSSLCVPRAWQDIKACVTGLREAPRLVLLSTDGYANSFQSEQAFLQVGTDVLSIVTRDGLEAVGRDIDRWLQETTEQGAGDDVTLAVLALTMPNGQGQLTPAESVTRSLPKASPGATSPAPSRGADVGGMRRSAPPPLIVGPLPRRHDIRDPQAKWSPRLISGMVLVGVLLVLIALAVGNRAAPQEHSPGEGGPINETQPTGNPASAAQEPPPRDVSGPIGMRDAMAVGNCAVLLDGGGVLWTRRDGSGAPGTVPGQGKGWERLTRRAKGQVEVAKSGGLDKRTVLVCAPSASRTSSSGHGKEPK